MSNNYVLLDRIELNDTAALVTFDNIPQSGYTDLLIKLSTRGTDSSTTDDVRIGFNGSFANFTTRDLLGTGAAVSSNTSGPGRILLGNTNANTANTFSSAEVYIPNYRSSNFKSYSSDGVQESNAATTIYAGLFAGLWSQTAAITSVSIDSNATSFAAGSTFSLYGLAQVGTTPAVAPKADGGNVIGTDGTYWYHAFLSNGTFTPQVGLTADVLVVAGGAGSGTIITGGGGAGGLLAFTNQSLPISNYTVTVGAGGAASNVADTRGGNGIDSQFGALTLVKGGGAGGYWPSFAGLTGGSGGGGGAGGFGGTTGPAGAGTSGQGNAGGTGSFGTAAGGAGGGGGAGAVGGDGSSFSSSAVGGNGGNGVNTYSAWATATGTGVSGYYAGGGGGAVNTPGSSQSGNGGLGGGGKGAANGFNAVAGTPNTGGGAGGGGNGSLPANGGSGIVIVRYLVA